MKSRLSVIALVLVGSIFGSMVVQQVRSSAAFAQVETIPDARKAERIRSYFVEGIGREPSILIPNVEGPGGFIVTDAVVQTDADYPRPFQMMQDGETVAYLTTHGFPDETESSSIYSMKAGIRLRAGAQLTVKVSIDDGTHWRVMLCGYTF